MTISKFPVDAPKQRVIKALELLGFHLIREKEHISMERINPDGSKTPLTMHNHTKIKSSTLKQFVLRREFHEMIFLKHTKEPDSGL